MTPSYGAHPSCFGSSPVFERAIESIPFNDSIGHLLQSSFKHPFTNSLGLRDHFAKVRPIREKQKSLNYGKMLHLLESTKLLCMYMCGGAKFSRLVFLCIVPFIVVSKAE